MWLSAAKYSTQTFRQLKTFFFSLCNTINCHECFILSITEKSRNEKVLVISGLEDIFMKIVFYLAWTAPLKQKCQRHQSFWNVIKNLWLCSQLCLWCFIRAFPVYLLCDTFFRTFWFSNEYIEVFIWLFISCKLHFVGFY